MHYKTIVLELLKQRPEMHNRLRKNRTMLATMEFYARELKTCHEGWKTRLSQALPVRSQSQIVSEALEMALRDLEECLEF